MNEPVVYRHLRLEARHRPTGKTRHYYGCGDEQRELPPPAALRIARYAGDAGFYLLYLDASGQEMTDTYHDSLEDALVQAEWEFGVGVDEWTVLRSEQAS